MKIWKIRRSIEEGEKSKRKRINIWKKWANTQETKSEIRNHQEDKKIFNESLKSIEKSITYPISNQRGIKILIPKVRNDRDETITSRKGVTNIFDWFYRKLFESNETEEKLQNILRHETTDEERINGEDHNITISLITDEKSQTVINKLKKGKVSENNDIRVEDSKNYDAAKKEKVK